MLIPIRNIMISSLKRILWVAALISNSAFAGNVCNIIQYLVEFHGGVTFLDSDTSFSTTLNLHKVSAAYFYYKGDYAFGKYTCIGNTLYFTQNSPDKINVDFQGELTEKEGGVLAFSYVSGHLNDLPLPSEFKNLQTKGSREISCNGDGDSIDRQIAKDGTVSTADGKHAFNLLIRNSKEPSICYGSAYYSFGMHPPRFVCSLKWEKGNWGKTLACVS